MAYLSVDTFDLAERVADAMIVMLFAIDTQYRSQQSIETRLVIRKTTTFLLHASPPLSG